MDFITLDLLGQRLVIRSEDPRWIAFLSDLWGPLVIEDSGDAPHQVSVLNDASGWLLDLRSGAPIHFDDPWALAERLRQLIVELAISLNPAVIGLHSAALAGSRGALLLAGPSGAGKTTLSRELIGRSWGYLSDDLAPIDIRTCEVLPFPKPLNIKDAASWPELIARWNPPGWLPEPRKALLAPIRLLASELGKRSQISFLIFPKFVPDGEASIEEVTAAKATSLCGPLVHRADIETVRLLARVAKGARRAKLTYPSREVALDLLLNWIKGPSRR